MRAFLGFLVFHSLTGCGADAPGSMGQGKCDGIAPSPRGYDAVAYELVGAFDWTAQQLNARETITLAVEPCHTTVELDAAVAIDRVQAAGADLPWTYDLEARHLVVDLAVLAPGAEPVSFTVDYHTPTSGALIASDGRDDDPVTSRVVFTDSEPDRGVSWLVAHHHPSDRARWSVELTVAADEDVVANGARTRDERTGDARVVRYELDKPIPTYLMAFAAGQLEHHDRVGTPPISLWHRRGLFVDADRHLEVVADMMKTFEDLVGSYPWDTYSVVLVPSPFGGGMENATITFNAEGLGQGTVSVVLNAHELAHQWFGDWVTMHDYQDVWVKEGMATLLESEAQRGSRDAASAGRLFGHDFSFSPSAAVVDPTLTGLGRYTSGPYQRAAWLITQIRARVGEAAFWASLRAMLTSHALGSLDGEGFVRSFAPALSDGEIDQVLATLERKPPPAIAMSTAANGNGHDVTLALDDPSQALITPIDVTVVDAAGSAMVHDMVAGTPLTVTVPAGGYLALDEADRHPSWANSFTVDASVFYGELAPRFVPSSTMARRTFEARSAAHQEQALAAFSLPPFDAPQFADFYNALDSV